LEKTNGIDGRKKKAESDFQAALRAYEDRQFRNENKLAELRQEHECKKQETLSRANEKNAAIEKIEVSYRKAEPWGIARLFHWSSG
jgi:hypothetical protein